MNGNQFDQERLSIVGAAFESGYMLGKTGAVGGRRRASPCLQYRGSPSITPEERAIIHKVPSVPITLDGEKAPPERVKEFNGRPLYYVLDNQESDEGVLQVFSTVDKLNEYRSRVIAGLKQRTRQESEGPLKMEATLRSSPFRGSAILYEHTKYEGQEWTFRGVDGPVDDFRSVFCQWYGCQDINDMVSSFVTNIVIPGDWYWPVYTYLWEHIDYEGSVFWVRNPYQIRDLVSYGWNDRVSSMSYFSSNF